MNKRRIRLIKIIIMVLLLIALCLIILDNYSFSGKVVDDGTNNEVPSDILPRHIFYGDLRASIKDYNGGCYPQSEVLPVLPDTQCCAGLTQIGIADESQDGCGFVTGVALCSACGNNQCDYGENECNCPVDCKAPPKRL